MKENAIRHQGYPLREFLSKYVEDPNGLTTIRKYRDEFEFKATIAAEQNAHLRIRSNFALLFAAAALAIDYSILPWAKASTFKAIEKCMRLALATLDPERPGATAFTPVDPHCLARKLKEKLGESDLVKVTLKHKISNEQADKRQGADGFLINGDIYLKPPRLKMWIPDRRERAVLRHSKVFRTERSDTSTIEQK